MLNSNMSDDRSEFNVKLEIQKTLQLINNDTNKLKQELIAINDLIKSNGSMNNAVQSAVENLQTMAEKLGINIEEVLNSNETENEVLPTTGNEGITSGDSEAATK